MIGEYKHKHKKEFGDFQTPQYFADEICKFLLDDLHISPNIIIEPTCGIGSFINSSIKKFYAKKIFGIELNNDYFNHVQKLITDNMSKSEIKLYNEDIFKFNFSKITNFINKDDNLLVIGNPPWVTNSDLSSLNSTNAPQKTNFKNFKGLEAITGKGNFDITEYIIIMLLNVFKEYNATYALLCKSSVSRNLVKEISKLNLPISKIKTYEIDAKKIFNASCDAVLLYIETNNCRTKECDIYSFEDKKKKKTFGWYNNKFISDIDSYKKTYAFDGECEFEWRQGIKHDCSKIFELDTMDTCYMNANKEIVDIENNYVYPLFKSSDLKEYLINKNRKNVIVTQSYINQDTSIIEKKSPKLWKYLCKNANIINNRKSIIYKNSPQFAIFGIGEYSFAKYKVAVSGFYKQPIFSLLETTKSAMLDDTCYFLGFNNLKDAQICTILLNSKIVQDFLQSIVFLDSKRPYTKDILMRIDISRICDYINYNQLIQYAKFMNISHNITHKDYEFFKQLLANNEEQLKIFAN